MIGPDRGFSFRGPLKDNQKRPFCSKSLKLLRVFEKQLAQFQMFEYLKFDLDKRLWVQSEQKFGVDPCSRQRVGPARSKHRCVRLCFKGRGLLGYSVLSLNTVEDQRQTVSLSFHCPPWLFETSVDRKAQLSPVKSTGKQCNSEAVEKLLRGGGYETSLYDARTLLRRLLKDERCYCIMLP